MPSGNLDLLFFKKLNIKTVSIYTF